MPELPEVETVVRELGEEIIGDTISSVEIFRSNPIVQGDLDAFQQQMSGRKFIDVRRRAKYLIFHLEPEKYLVAHLRMTGKFIISNPLPEPTKYNRVWFNLKSNRVLIFDDIRCFGTLEVYAKLSDSKSLKKLGIEPLSAGLTPEYFKKLLHSSKREIKSILLDQKFVVGLGNIYVSEILFRAKIHPQRIAGKINKKEWSRIVNNTQYILQEAIKNNGTTISDFRRVDDKTGKFQQFLQVYDKKEEPCPECGLPIQRIVQQQRSTYFCAECQR
ncbi:MAG: bifunctional DNA-formamidopyrimidine glycosylase/DNA-(apurinic or apyrimidinic site) lyase [SAR324 cluster bacterium]|nr:bifunctional DNA-formamidopyrimidine glycosylase/DNA-(apurinic or apyrimidinic site) lyase [SAR324 cluster bacterium]